MRLPWQGGKGGEGAEGQQAPPAEGQPAADAPAGGEQRRPSQAAPAGQEQRRPSQAPAGQEQRRASQAPAGQEQRRPSGAAPAAAPPAEPAPAAAPAPPAKAPPGAKAAAALAAKKNPPPPAAAAPPAQEQAAAPPAPEPVTMEAKVTSRGGTPTPSGVKKCGRWTLDQLRVTDGMLPLQNGTNRFDSQKGMTGFGTPRNTSLKIKSDCLQEIPEEIAGLSHLEVRLQSGTNKYDSQKGMTGFGTGRDVVRESKGVNRNPKDLPELSEEKILLCEGIVRLQSGTNKFASQKGGVGVGTGLGTNRREVTKMIDSKHPEYNHETSIDQSIIRLQAGTNKFASQAGGVGVGTGMGTNRREITKMLDTKHPDQLVDHPDQATIGGQMGSNQYASQRGMTGFGQPRWEVLQVPGLNRQIQIGQGLVPYQMGSNLYASQKGMVGFGTGRDVVRESNPEGDPIPFEEQQKSQTLIRFQAGWNKGDSQKGYTSFGSPRDVKGKHLKRIWELEYPEEDYVKPI